MKQRNRVWRVLGAMVSAAFLAQSASAANVLAPGSMVAGRSIAEWTAAWWTWAVQAPAAQNPLADTTGASAGVNNGGPVFFVAGSDGSSGAVTRTFDVPAGRPLLVPMINFFDTEPSIHDSGEPLADRQAAANIVVNNWLASVDTASLFASIDGAAVRESGAVPRSDGIVLDGADRGRQRDRVNATVCEVGDVLDPTKSAGYWLMIDGLTPGPHTLHLGGSTNEFTTDSNCCTNGTFPAFLQDNTFNVNVVPEPPTALLMLLGVCAWQARAARKRSSAGNRARDANPGQP